MRHRTHRHQYLLASLAMILLAALYSGAACADDYVFVDSFESNDCSQPLACAVPSAGFACIAGQLTDAAATSPLHARFNVGLACGSGAIGGPCDLAVTAHDAVDFQTNPGGSFPLAAGDIVVDGCGRYRFANLSVPASGHVAIVSDDAPGGSAYMPAATPHALAPSQRVDGVTAIAARLDDVTAWGLMAGQDYLNDGVLLFAFSTNGIPTAGVAVAGTGTAHYFSDVDAQRFSVSAAATATGADGSALFVGTANVAAGGESAGCMWPAMSPNTISVAGVVFYLEFACQ